ncbi:PhzF family phenazine biosynthesis protein [Microbacterium sp. NPDC056234]|uniref:PhzF family phenazine biosynthesis protein n=1 Tax=Microbacterium sp. NPDC056234 TaxID=3345757 RepID=UPI0035D5E440
MTLDQRRRLPFSWVDVFTDSPLAGNPLPVVADADGLSVESMQLIAREFNQSETTFVMRADFDADWKLRSFTPSGVEVSGAGHNAMGAWISLAASGQLDPNRDHFVQQIGDELLDVRVTTRAPGSASVSMLQSDPVFVRTAATNAVLAEILRVPFCRIGSVITVASTGVPHLLVPLTDAEIVDRVDPNSDRLRPFLSELGAEGCYVYALTPEAEGSDAYARFFNPTVGIVEDPATGTAAGPLAAMMARDGAVRSAGSVRIEQGTRLGRSSILNLDVAEGVRLSGRGVVIAEGAMFV